MKNFKIAIQSDGLLYRSENQWYCNCTFLFFAREIGRFFTKTFFIVPVERGNCYQKYPQFSCYEGQKIVALKPYRSVEEYYRRLPRFIVENTLMMLPALKEADIIFLRIPGMNALLLAFLSLACRKPLFCYFVGDEESVIEKGLKYRGLKLRVARMVASFHTYLYKKIVQFSKASFYLSQDLKEKFSKYNQNSFFTFTSLVEEGDFSQQEPRKLSDPVILLYVGRLSHEKGLEYLIKSIHYLDKSRYSLLICGDGPHRERLNKFVSESGLNHNVSFLGFIPWGEKLWEVYRKADIFVLPSLSEGVPKVLLEAMSQGLPVIATYVGGIPDIIRHMKNGILVSPGSSKAIANAIKLIVNDEGLRMKIIEKGFECAKEHTAERQAEKIAKIIYEMAK